MNQTWNANQYSSGFSFVYKYGSDVLSLLDIPEGSHVLDLGCGTGALSGALRDKGYRVTGLDASGEMLAKAREAFPDIEFMQADATDFRLDAPVDAVFSNAVLHWIDAQRQPMMMECVRNALKPGGVFVLEMGGVYCCRAIHDALAESFSRYGYDYVMPFFFPSIGEYASLLENAGFMVRYALHFDRPTELVGSDGLYDWINMFVKIPFKNVSAEDREKIMRDTVDALRDKLFHGGKWYSDYTRLRIKAEKIPG